MLPMGKLDGRVALITGAGSGIGRATAILFAKEGAKVVVADYDSVGGQETVRMITEAGGEAILVRTDVSRSPDAEQMVKTTADTYGRIDILFNNAGVLGAMANTADVTEDGWESVIDVNLKGAFLGSKYAIPLMIEQGEGSIINTASGASFVGLAGLAAYTASKGGVMQLTKTMALEYANLNVRVNCICPGMIATKIDGSSSPGNKPGLEALGKALVETIPLGRVGRPDDIAKAALYLASEDSSYVTGTALIVDGGLLLTR
jgi:NAD(P)-dependent dehydrogenase (short-subunit alcohol dehydrogenase family)